MEVDLDTGVGTESDRDVERVRIPKKEGWENGRGTALRIPAPNLDTGKEE